MLNILVITEIQSDSPLWQQLRTQTSLSLPAGNKVQDWAGGASPFLEHRNRETFLPVSPFCTPSSLFIERQLMGTRPTTWMTDQPQIELDWPLGSLCSHLWSCKITNTFKKLLLTEENRTQNSWKEWDKASKPIFDLKTTGDFLGNYPPKLPFMGRQGSRNQTVCLQVKGESSQHFRSWILDVKVQRNLRGSARE